MSQDWTTPQKTKDAKVKKEAAEKDLDDRVAVIRRQFDAQSATPKSAPQPPASTVQDLPAKVVSQSDKLDQQRQNAAIIKQTKTLLSTLPVNDPFISVLDQRLTALRSAACNDAPTSEKPSKRR